MNEVKTQQKKSSPGLSLPRVQQQPSLSTPASSPQNTLTSSLKTKNLPSSVLISKLRQRVLAKKRGEVSTDVKLTIAPGASIIDRLISYIAHLIKVLDLLIFGKLKKLLTPQRRTSPIRHDPTKTSVTSELQLPKATKLEDTKEIAVNKVNFEDDEEEEKK